MVTGGFWGAKIEGHETKKTGVTLKVLLSSVGAGILIRKQNSGENWISLGIDLIMSMKKKKNFSFEALLLEANLQLTVFLYANGRPLW